MTLETLKLTVIQLKDVKVTGDDENVVTITLTEKIKGTARC